jgi:hypothetical protein
MTRRRATTRTFPVEESWASIRVAAAPTPPRKDEDMGYFAAEWAPVGKAYVCSLGLSVLVALNDDTASSLHRLDHNNIYAAWREVRRRFGLVVAEVDLLQGGGNGEFRLLDDELPAAPTNWIDDVREALEDADRSLRQLTKKALAAENKVAARRADLADQVRDIACDSHIHYAPPDTSRWTVTMRSARNSHSRFGPAPPALIVKGENDAVIARALLPNGPLLPEKEWQRQAVAVFLEREHGQTFGPSPMELDLWEPFLAAHVWPQRSDADLYHVQIGRDPTSDPLYVHAAVFIPSRRAAVVVTHAWSQPVARLLKRHGFDVERVYSRADLPDDLDNAEVRSALAWDPGTWIPDTDAFRTEYVATRLTEDARALVPAAVAEAVERSWRYRTAHSWQRRRGPELWDDAASIEALLAATPSVGLPPEADAALRHAQAISQGHAALLAAIELSRVAPAWWDELPWSPIGSVLAPDDARAKRSRLALLLPEERARCGQPALSDLIVSVDFRSPRLPRAGDDDYLARLLLAAAEFWRDRGVRPSTSDTTRQCSLCGTPFDGTSTDLSDLVMTGANRYCAACLGSVAWYAVDTGDGGPLPTDWAIEAIQLLADVHGGPVAREQMLAPVAAIDVRETDRQVLLRIALVEYAQGGSWYELQRVAGVIGDEWRPSFGTYCTATDGHACRSLFERHIDDFLSSAGIMHDTEPLYPFDPELNTTGLRADWRLDDGTLVEAAGMLESPSYAAKIALKQKIADRNDIRLVVVTPADLRDLDGVFGVER